MSVTRLQFAAFIGSHGARSGSLRDTVSAFQLSAHVVNPVTEHQLFPGPTAGHGGESTGTTVMRSAPRERHSGRRPTRATRRPRLHVDTHAFHFEEVVATAPGAQWAS